MSGQKQKNFLAIHAILLSNIKGKTCTITPYEVSVDLPPYTPGSGEAGSALIPLPGGVDG